MRRQEQDRTSRRAAAALAVLFFCCFSDNMGFIQNISPMIVPQLQISAGAPYDVAPNSSSGARYQMVQACGLMRRSGLP